MATREGPSSSTESPYRKRPLDGCADEERGLDIRFKRQAVTEGNGRVQKKTLRNGLSGKSHANQAAGSTPSTPELQRYDDFNNKPPSSEIQEESRKRPTSPNTPSDRDSPASSGIVSEGEEAPPAYIYCPIPTSSAPSVYPEIPDNYTDEQVAQGNQVGVPPILNDHGPASEAPGVISARVQKSLPATGYSSSSSRPIIARCIITSKEAGIIIGKNGKNIADIRETSGAKVMISEQIQGAQDRILTITGPIGNITKAFSSISHMISDDVQNDDAPSRGMAKNATIKLLIPHTKMGIIIGKSGSRIREIQGQSSARILASEEMLPNSTERVVTVIGAPGAIQIAVYNIMMALQDFSGDDFAFIPYKPHSAGAHGYLRIPGRSGLPPGGTAYGKQHIPLQIQPNHPDHLQAYYGHFDIGQHNYQQPHSQLTPHAPHPASYQSIQLQQIFIPNEMVGSIIGKQGCKINEIRQISGCHIKIAEARHASPDRLVTIIGSAEANQMALFLLYDRLENEKSRLESMRNSATTTRT